MTQRSCCVPNCLVKRGDDVLHHFPNPSNPAQIERFRTWVMKVGGDIIKEQNDFIYKNRRVCHRHFEEVYTFPNKKLSALAIPSLHIPGVHAGPHRVIVQPATVMLSTTNEDASTSLNPGAPADPQVVIVQPATVMQSTTNEDASTSLNPGVHADPQGVIVQPATVMQFMQSTTNENASTSYKPGYRKVSKPATALEKQLRNIITETKLKLRKSQSIRRKLKIQTEMAAKFTKSSGYSILKRKMTPAAQIFFNMQLNESGKKPTGRRFTLDEKILCLSLYKPCPKAYRLLGQLCVLPKRRTLDTLLDKIRLSPGINDIIFHHLKKRVEKMPAAHKYCCVIFDEMAISPNLYYDKSKDIIRGFADNGVERCKTFCDHVCVFMIRGVLKKFKQPLAFTFCKGSTKSEELSIFLKNIISKITDCGLNVVATVCDQGASNMAALNILMNATKADVIKDGKNYTGGYFIVNSKKIYAIYDPPHLIKGIRNNLLTKDLEFREDGKIKRASWCHVEALYRQGPGYRGVKLVNKLTAQHVIPSCIPKMRVKHCTQVFSENVGRTMGFMAEIGRLPNSSKDTADLLLFFDKLFDSVNGNCHKPDPGKIYRSAVTPRSPHRSLWYRCLPVLKSMEFITKSGRKGTVPSITSWVKSIEAFLALTKDLHSAGLKSILLRNINQDPLENFFGSIRAHGLRNIMPSANAFINSYKSLLISNITSNKSVGANCEADNLDLLHSLKCLIVDNEPQQVSIEKDIEITNDHLCILETDVDDLIKNPKYKEKCAAVVYCSGWLIHILKKKIYKYIMLSDSRPRLQVSQSL